MACILPIVHYYVFQASWQIHQRVLFETLGGAQPFPHSDYQGFCFEVSLIPCCRPCYQMRCGVCHNFRIHHHCCLFRFHGWAPPQNQIQNQSSYYVFLSMKVVWMMGEWFRRFLGFDSPGCERHGPVVFLVAIGSRARLPGRLKTG